MKPNFKNPVTGEEFFISRYRTKLSNSGELIGHFDKWNKDIVDPKTGDKLVPIPKEYEGGAPMIGTSKAGIQAQLKKRSRAHNRKGEIKERREALTRDASFIKKSLGGGGIISG